MRVDDRLQQIGKVEDCRGIVGYRYLGLGIGVAIAKVGVGYLDDVIAIEENRMLLQIRMRNEQYLVVGLSASRHEARVVDQSIIELEVVRFREIVAWRPCA